MESKMKTKNLLVSFCTLVLVLVLAASVSAADLADKEAVAVEDMFVYNNGAVTNVDTSLVAGEYQTIDVYFTALEDDTDVTVEIELEGEKVENRVVSQVFDVIAGRSYKKSLKLYVPYELKDDRNDTLSLNIEIDGKDHKSILDTIFLTVQRPPYNAVVKSITTPSIINAGENFPVEIVLKNLGFNDLDDVYVSARIAELNIFQGPKWFGDLVYIEDCNNNCDKEDTVEGRLYLDVPYNVEPGTYTLEVLVQNDDTKSLESRSIVIESDFSDEVIATSTKKTVAENEDAIYKFLLVNPTNKIKVYNIATESNVSTEVESIVAVPAGSSKIVELAASSDKKGSYNFEVTILSNNKIVDTVMYELEVKGNSTNAITVLTVVLAIVFLVLLVVLVVLIAKKPEKKEDFGESYY